MHEDKETQMTPQKANTPLRGTMSEEIGGAVVHQPKLVLKRKRRKSCLSMIRQGCIHQYRE